MIRLIEGGFYSSKTDSLIPQIKRLIEEQKRAYLIVPEQQTLLSEGEMAKALPPSAPLYFEVSNFTRFANSVFRALGGVAKEYVDRTRRMLVMWQTLSALSPMLDMTKNVREINTGLVDKAISAVVNMQSYGIEAEDLITCAAEIHAGNQRLKSKLSDLSKIMSLYLNILKEKYGSVGDDIALLCSVLEKNPDYLADSEIFIEGFTSFTEGQYKLISILAKRARVSVVLTLPRLLSDSAEYTEARTVEARLKRIANKIGTELKLTRVDAKRNDTKELLSDVGELLWHNFINLEFDEYPEDERNSLRIFEGASPYEMCDFIGADIKRRVIEGARYSDFAIIARELEDYSGILSSALSSYEIPHFLSRSRDVSSFEATKLINSAFRVISSGFSRDEVISYSKCSLCGISRDACDEFEEYTRKWQLTKSRFYDGILWNMSPRGLETVDEADSAALVEINKTKNTLIEPLLVFKSDIETCKTVLDFSGALMGFLRSLKLEGRIYESALELKSVGEERFAEDNCRIWKIICDSLDLLCSTVGELETTPNGYTSLLSIVFSAVKVGKIPAHADEVMLGSADMIRLSGKRHIYLIGVNSGEFPRSVKESSYFSEREKLSLSELGLPITPELEIDYSRELFAFSRAFSYARESVTLIYTKSACDFTALERSGIIDRISEICQGKIKIKRISSIPPCDFIYTKKSALMSLGKISDTSFISFFSKEEDGELLGIYRMALSDIENKNLSLSREVTDEIYQSDIRLSSSRIEKYNKCPFAYFCEYNLGLDSGEIAKFDARNIGSFLHSVLENFFFEVKEKKIPLDSLTDEKKEEIIKRHAKSYVNSVMGDEQANKARGEIMLSRLTKSVFHVVDSLCDEFAGSSFIPSYFELKIGKSNDEASPSPVKFRNEKGKSVYVAGIIDRVDTFEHNGDVYVRVVDYKTGKKEFSPSDIDEGENLQMFLYLKSICDTKNSKFRESIGVSKDGKLIPAGVIYVKTDLSDIVIPSPSEDVALEAFRKAQSRKGMLLNDDISLGAMNKSYIPIKYTSNNSVDKRTEKYLYTEDGWDELSRKVEGAVCRVSDSMQSGNINASPKKKSDSSPCDYCKYSPICRSRS